MNRKQSAQLATLIYLPVAACSLLHSDSKTVFLVMLGWVLAIVMIRFPEEINEYTLGAVGRGGGVIDNPTPGFMISLFGWLVLAALLAFILYECRILPGI